MPSASHIGKAGHLAVMAELANRGYNVALPEIDIGDDIFAVNDANGNLWRIQVKTSVAKERKKAFTGQFRVRATAITANPYPELYFVFALRMPDRYRFLVLGRQVLQNYVVADNLGSASTAQGVNWRTFYVRFLKAGGAICNARDLSHHLEDWATWPAL